MVLQLSPTLGTTERFLGDEKFYKEVEAVPFSSMKGKLISILERYGNSIGDKLKFSMQTSIHLLTLNTCLKCINVHWLGGL